MLLRGDHTHGGKAWGEPEGAFVPNARQAAAMADALDDLKQLMDALRDSVPYDVAAVHLDAAVAALAGVTGLAVADDVLNRVFSEFCIGK